MKVLRGFSRTIASVEAVNAKVKLGRLRGRSRAYIQLMREGKGVKRRARKCNIQNGKYRLVGLYLLGLEGVAQLPSCRRAVLVRSGKVWRGLMRSV